MKTLIAIVGLSVFLSGCNLFGGGKRPTETVYRPIFPPQALTLPCVPEKPENVSLGDLIIIQQNTINQCNSQLRAIRDWRERQESKDKEDNED